jgi:cytochrome c oxidase assembly factor CtaG
VALVLALMSGIDTFQELLFFMHMTQHLLLVMIAPPLFWLAAPMPISFWGLPRNARLALGKPLLGRHSPFRKALVEISAPGVIWLVFTATLWLWHDPNAYQAAIENQSLHDFEHLTFFATGMLLWWHIVAAAPVIHKRRSYVVRLSVIVLTYFQTIILGIGITMWGDVIYEHYANVPRLWGIDAKTDQTYGGLIMWLPGGMMYLIAVLVLIGSMIRESERKARYQQRIDTGKLISSP